MVIGLKRGFIHLYRIFAKWAEENGFGNPVLGEKHFLVSGPKMTSLEIKELPGTAVEVLIQ